MNVADLLQRRAQAQPTSPAVIAGDREISYESLDALVWGLCAELRTRGLQPGQVVGLHLTDPFAHLVAVLALARSGLTSVALPPGGDRDPACLDLLDRTRAAALVHDSGRWQDPGRQVLGWDPDAIWQLRGRPDDSLRVAEPSAPMLIKTSSGTTGAPKRVIASHAGMLASMQRELQSIGYPPGERYLTPVSLRFDGPRRRVLCCLAGGGTVVLPPRRFDLREIGELIERHRVGHFSCVPSQAWEMAQAVPEGKVRHPGLRCFRISAGPSDARLHELIRRRLSPRLVISYGCTELGPITMADPAMVAADPQSVGRPLPGITLQIVSDEDEVLPPGAIGQIRIRAEGMPSGYEGDPALTAQRFRNGWFHPGDLGCLRADGSLRHMGRADDMMIMNGINIYPAELEQAMRTHPAVLDAVALPLRHPAAHEVPVCAVVLAEGQAPDEGELIAHGRRLLGARGPYRVVALESMPRNEHGKVVRSRLTELVTERLSAGRPPAGPTGAPRRPTFQQPSLRLAVAFRVPAAPGFTGLDLGLRALMGEHPGDPSDAGPAPANGDAAKNAHAWMARAALWARTLLQAARVPAFDVPRVADCRPDEGSPGTWKAQVELPWVEEVPAKVYADALAAAGELMRKASGPSLDEAQREMLFSAARAAIQKLMAQGLPFGGSTLPVLREARRQSIPFLHRGAGVFQLGWGRQARLLDRSIGRDDSAIGSRIANDKVSTAVWLRNAGLPAPRHEVVGDAKAAGEVGARLGWPVVLKPADGERGEGVTMDVRDEARAAQAFEEALRASPSRRVLVERQVPGTCHRLFIAGGRLLYAVKRHPMCVFGDGRSDVASLVARECARQASLPPWQRSGIQPLDELALASLAAAGLAPSSIAPNGQRVPLRPVESTRWGGVDEDVTDAVHPDNLAAALQAAELLGLGHAGVDLITEDIGQPWHDSGAIINEVNFSPLLGGAAISRSYLPRFLGRFVPGRGLIPVEVFVGGGAAWAAAVRRCEAWRAAGLQAFACSSDRTEGPDGRWPMAVSGLRARSRALVLSSRVQALALVVQNDELLGQPLPLPAVQEVMWVDRELVQAGSPGQPLAAGRLKALEQLLQAWAVPGLFEDAQASV